jgi:hypothetical protein
MSGKIVTDEQILQAIDEARQENEGHFGPQSLDELGSQLGELLGRHIPLSKGILSWRLTNWRRTGLFDRGLVGGLKAGRGLHALSLYVTEEGKKLLLEGNGHESVESN